jgi:membrane protein DedA with SNARE-associated domain
MNEAEIADLLARYGTPFLGLATFASCLIVPLPASVIMITAGGLAASGLLPPTAVFFWAFLGAILGDQSGYFLGARVAHPLERFAARRARTAALWARAHDMLDRFGGPGVFLSRWLLSPLGPYVNFICGAADMTWGRFTVFAVPGKAVWVLIYVGLGFGVIGNLDWLAAALPGTVGLVSIIAGACIVFAGWRIWRRRKTRV